MNLVATKTLLFITIIWSFLLKNLSLKQRMIRLKIFSHLRSIELIN